MGKILRALDKMQSKRTLAEEAVPLSKLWHGTANTRILNAPAIDYYQVLSLLESGKHLCSMSNPNIQSTEEIGIVDDFEPQDFGPDRAGMLNMLYVISQNLMFNFSIGRPGLGNSFQSLSCA
ncbi:hypothetical protein PHLCEN_2v5970 [Hermanssonia centrifuga]|uniref:Uncharacterized protein n=1 Tax=Hermanssonia centrifuga TaxID=98765 RepID=A0A2R6P0S2_9APHY|nr:hypothetical protein PHLCEN_2v5970 [Hermanssonia centrifuga]